LALSALAKLYPDLPEDEKDQVKGAFTIVHALLNLADEGDDNTMFFSHQDNTVSQLKTTYFLVRGIVDITKALEEETQINEEQVVSLANYFVQQKYTSSISEAYVALFGLHACNEESFARPIVLSLATGSVHSASAKGEEGFVKVRVTDLFGNSNGKNGVFLIKAKSGDSETAILSNQELKVSSSDPTIYHLNFLATKPDPGMYLMQFRVTPESDKWQSIEATRTIKVVAKIKIEDVELVVSDKYEEEVSEIRKHSLKFEDKKPADVIRVESYQSIRLQFKLKSAASARSVLAHQAFVKFTSKNTSEDLFFVCLPTVGKTYKFSLNLEKVANSFGNRSGEYDVSLLVGDAFIDNSFEWTLATVSLHFEGEPSEGSKSSHGPRPTIGHKFRTASTMAHETTSKSFTVAVFLPLLVLLIGLISVGGLNFSNFPTGFHAIFALGFQLCLAAILVLNYYYWVQLNLFQTLTYLGLLSLPTIFFGNKTLQFLATKRSAEQKQHAD